MRESCDLIIKSKYIVLDENTYIENAAIVIRDGVVVWVGGCNEVDYKFKCENTVLRKKHIVMPGIVDGHVHTQQILLRSSVTDYMLELPPIWTSYLIPFEEKLGSNLAFLSSMLSLLNMVSNGTTFFIEAGAPYPRELFNAAVKVGLRGVVAASTFDTGYENAPDTKEALAETEETLRLESDRVIGWGSIRELMMASKELIEGVVELCEKYGRGLTMHLAEYQGEVDYSLTKYGVRTLKAIDSIGVTKVKPLLLSHGVFFSCEELEILVSKRIGVCWCPTVDSLLMSPHWIHVTPALYREKLIYCFGSDGGCFSNLDILHEAKVARCLGKSMNTSMMYSKSSFTSRDLLKGLFGSSGEVCGFKIGCLKPGFKADITIVSLDEAGVYPSYNPIETITCFAEGSSVNDVIVDGEFIYENKVFKKVKLNDILSALDKEIDRVEKIIAELRESLPLKTR